MFYTNTLIWLAVDVLHKHTLTNNQSITFWQLYKMWKGGRGVYIPWRSCALGNCLLLLVFCFSHKWQVTLIIIYKWSIIIVIYIYICIYTNMVIASPVSVTDLTFGSTAAAQESCTPVFHPPLQWLTRDPFFLFFFTTQNCWTHTVSFISIRLIRSLAFLLPSSNVVWLFIQSGFSWSHVLCVVRVLFQRCNRLVTLFDGLHS